MSDFFAHPLALVETQEIGNGTRVWAWTHVMEGARIGTDCNVGEHCFVERGATLGDRVTVKNGVSVWEGTRVGNDVFLGPHCVLTNDLHPRSRNKDWVLSPVVLQDGCSIGAGATLLGGITVGRHALVSAGAVVTRDVPDQALVVGNPARQLGWVCTCGHPLVEEGGRLTCDCGRAYLLADDALRPAP